MEIKVINIVGARPQLMKASILSRIFAESERFCEILLHTGQHYDANMALTLMQELFTKTPDYQLSTGGKSELSMLAAQIVEIEKIISKEDPNYVISYGDTTTTLAGALAARKLNIKHVHVEAGVRNFDMDMPEEVNRILVDSISELNFCATEKSMRNLLIEGHEQRSKFSTTLFSGDLMLDCFIATSKKMKSGIKPIKSLQVGKDKFIYVTIHRQSNVDTEQTLREIVTALNAINSEIPVVLPLHPRTRNMLEKFNICIDFETIEPLSYAESIDVLLRSTYVITDSGGLVREAFFAKKPSLLLLEEPLWPEIEEVNCSISTRVVSSSVILKQYENLKKLQGRFDVPVFGNGEAGLNIVRAIESDFDGQSLLD